MGLEQPDRLIEGEQWAAPRQDDARHWLSIYDELIALHEHLLRQVDTGPAHLAAERRRVIERSLGRLSSRREYWRNWWVSVTGLDYDAGQRQLRFRDRHMTLTGREAQLLELFLDHPHKTFSSRQVLEQAWRDEDLSEEQVRTYVVRLRQKLRGLGVPGQLRSVARQGYALELGD
jgi:DNA-binding response OmpR family regulator